MIEINLRKSLNASAGEMLLDISCQVEKGEFVTIYGESGAGKTSILRMLAGLMEPDSGVINVNNETWFDSSSKVNLKPQKRKIGFVFQDYALFPNMSVKENLLYALDKGQDDSIVDELIEIIELAHLQDRRPDTLSGGQRQRVALARAIVRKPDILLLDEPLSALDETMRMKLQDYILLLHHRYKVTTIMVSHDIGEIFKMSNRILILENGSVVRQGTPDEIFTKDKLSGKFRFVGTILKIQKNEVVNIVSVLSGNNLIKVIATDEDLNEIFIGDKVMIVSKAFNPLIMKI